MALKHAMVPTVAAVQGMALGGGCEFVMHASHRVLALESYVGLVEAGVGLIPAGGGCKEFALQAASLASRAAGATFPFIQNMFQTIAMANVSKSACRPWSWALPRRPTTSSSTPASCCTWPCTGPAPLPNPATSHRWSSAP
jgi:hypothetical protein